jgi:hypothetical protein
VVPALRLGDSVLANLVEQRLVADLQHGGSLLAIPVGLLCSSACVMARASASSLAERASDFRPPESERFADESPGTPPLPSLLGLLLIGFYSLLEDSSGQP